MANKSTNKDSLDVAGRNYEVDDYKRTDPYVIWIGKNP